MMQDDTLQESRHLEHRNFQRTSKFAWLDFYEEHFDLPRRLILLVTNRRVLVVQVSKWNCPFTD